MLACEAPAAYEVEPVDFAAENLGGQFASLGEQLEDVQILLLGENGHGVGEFSAAKVAMIKWLYEAHGFETVIFESGFFECGYAWSRISSLSEDQALYDCLRYPFQHAELLPLFSFIKEKSKSDDPLVLAGMDFQAQGYDSEARPTYLNNVLLNAGADIASTIATADTALHLPETLGGKGDDLYAWAYTNRADLRALYLQAADQTSGWEQWTFLLTTGWIDRLTIRGKAEMENANRPGRYYELRDEWMARGVAAHADSIDTARKVIVWLHNDHGRYGKIDGSGARATGNYLREWYGDAVYSIGFFMGEGTIADNGRTEREMKVPEPGGIENIMQATGAEASYLILRNNNNKEIKKWAGNKQPYLRMGITPMTMVPADEFDALIYIDKVKPPNYDVR